MIMLTKLALTYKASIFKWYVDLKRKHISDITRRNHFPTESAIKIPVGILGGHWYKGQG